MRDDDVSAESWYYVHTWSKTEPLGRHSWVGCWELEMLAGADRGVLSVWVGLEDEGEMEFPSLCRE